MVFPLAVSGLINESATGCKWPAVRVELGVRRGRLPVVRCSLSIPGRRTFPLQNISASPRSVWFGSSGLWTKGFKAALEYHQKASAATLQTLQRVGTMIRSTSMDYIGALGTKKTFNTQPSPDQQPPEGDDQDSGAGQLKASLSRFLTTASKAEVFQAAMMADLSNMAYDVQQISQRCLQDTHNLILVTHSKAGQMPAVSAELDLVVEPVSPVLLYASIELQPDRADLLYRSQSPASPTAGGGMPQSPAAAGAAPGYFGSYPISGSSQVGSAPSTPRTPFVLSSFAETEDFLAPAEVQLVTASGAIGNPGAPRHRSSALEGCSSSSTPAAAPAAVEASTLQHSSSAGAALALQLMHYQQQDFDALSVFSQHHQLSTGAAEQHAMLELQQQEQQVLLEMQQTQQLQSLLQQKQAIMQQLQEQATFSEINSGAAATTASSNNAWWWLQQLQQHAAEAATRASTKANPSSRASTGEVPPADWFVCDGPGTSTSGPVRYVVIQGSISLDHWRINLTIDPCEFENGALGGVKVHRGVYEAALQMYDSLAPFVREHLAKHPDGKIAFTGHSLGGSLATLLMLLLLHRGVLPAANMHSVLTFGSPAIFCEGATGSTPSAGACNSCCLPCQHRAERSAASAAVGAAAAASNGAASPSRAPCDNGLEWKAPFKMPAGAPSAQGGLLGRLGLAPESVVNVIMTRDIVPRAFVCDYTLVADVLKSWVPSFKEHVGLASCKEHKALYNFIGTVEVLQPSLDCPFILPDETHPMLPQEAALYKLTEPCCKLPDPVPVAAHAAPASFTGLPASDATLTGHGGSCHGCSACNGSCKGCCGASNSSPISNGSANKSEKKSKGKLASFGSWGSLATLSSTSLTSVIADLTSTFTLVTGNNGSVVSLPVTAEEAQADATAALAAAADAVNQHAERVLTAAEPTEADAHASAMLQLTDAVSPSATTETLNLTLGDAILTFMNSPHPLETLGEMRAYGPSGAISRFHNPQSYTTALQHLMGNHTNSA